MAKLTLDIDSNAFGVFNQAVSKMDELNHGVNTFGKEGKASFDSVNKEAQKYTDNIKQSASESVTSANKIVDGKNKEKSALVALKAQLVEITEYEKKLQEQRLNAAPGKVQEQFNKKIAEAQVEIKRLNEEFVTLGSESTKSMGNLNLELKDLKRQIHASTDPEEINRLTHAAGELQSKINDTNQAVQVFTNNNKAGQAKTLFAEIGHDLHNMDFDSANKKSKELAHILKTVSFKEIATGVKDFAGTLLNVGKAMLLNPFTVLILTIVAAGLAIKSFIDSTHAGEQALKDNAEALKEVTNATNDLIKANRDLAVENDINSKKITKTDGERLKNQNKFKDQYLEILKQQREATEVFNAAIAVDDEAGMIRKTDLRKRQNQGLKDIEVTYGKELKALLLQFNEEDRRIRIEDSVEKERKQKEANDKRIALQKELDAMLKDLLKRYQASEVEMLYGKEKLDKQREYALAEVDVLRKSIIEKGKLINSNFKLNAEQEREIAYIKVGINEKYAEDIIAIEIDKATRIAAAQKAQMDNDLKFLELQTRLRIAAVNGSSRPDGVVSEQTFEMIKAKNILIIQKQALEEQFQVKIDGMNAEAQVQITANQNEIASLEGHNDEVSLLRKKQAFENIQTIKSNLGLETEVLKVETDVQINELGKQIEESSKKISARGGLIDWQTLLGLSDKDFAALKQAIGAIIPEIQNILSVYFASQNEIVDNQLSNNQKLIDAHDELIGNLTNNLTKEEELRKRGLANNVDAVKKQLEAEQAARNRDMEEQKKLQQKKKDLAKQQFIIDTAVQASNLITAVSDVFATYAENPVIAAILAAAMVGSFIAVKSSAYKAIDKETPQGFKDGVIDLQGPGTETSDDIDAKLSKGESVMTAEETRRHKALLLGIRNKDLRMMEIGIRNLIDGTGISLSSDIPASLSHQKDSLRTAEHGYLFSMDNSGVEGRLDKLEGHMVLIAKKAGYRRYQNKNGDDIIIKGEATRIIRNNG